MTGKKKLNLISKDFQAWADYLDTPTADVNGAGKPK
jgi:hypothetical protein